MLVMLYLQTLYHMQGYRADKILIDIHEKRVRTLREKKKSKSMSQQTLNEKSRC